MGKCELVTIMLDICLIIITIIISIFCNQNVVIFISSVLLHVTGALTLDTNCNNPHLLNKTSSIDTQMVYS